MQITATSWLIRIIHYVQIEPALYIWRKRASVAYLLVLLMLCSCATSNITKERDVDQNEGIMITRVHSNKKNAEFLVHSKNGILPSARISGPEEYLSVVPIVSGEMSFTIIMWGGYETRLRRHTPFLIEPGFISYVGDIHFKMGPTSFWSGSAQVEFQVIDNEVETIAIARKEYPWLFQKYPYRKAMPVYRLKTEEGYQEVPEIKELKEKIETDEKRQQDKKESGERGGGE